MVAGEHVAVAVVVDPAQTILALRGRGSLHPVLHHEARGELIQQPRGGAGLQRNIASIYLLSSSGPNVKGKVKIGRRGLWLTHNKKDKKLICEHIQSVRQCHEADPETCQWFKNVQNALLDHIEEKT